MRKSAAAVSVAWGLGTPQDLCLPARRLALSPAPALWAVAQAAGGQLIGAGLIPLAQSFIEFTRADGTPVPVASPRLAVNGFYRHMRNPIYAGSLAALIGEVLLSAQ